MHRHPAIVWLWNLVVPGAGLIMLRREWLGFCLALLYSLCANFAVTGLLIAPMAWPRWLVAISAVLAGLAWALAQVLCLLQWKNAVLHTTSLTRNSQPEGLPSTRAVHRA